MPKRVTLKQLIDSGFLQAGEELTCEPYRGSGEIYQASLNSDGVIRNLRENVAQLTPSEFQELVRQYVEDKGFADAEITVVLKMTI